MAGKTLKIYSDANVNDIPNETTKTTKNTKTNQQNYTVKNGDSLYSIASKTIQQLQS